MSKRKNNDEDDPEIEINPRGKLKLRNLTGINNNLRSILTFTISCSKNKTAQAEFDTGGTKETITKENNSAKSTQKYQW